MKRKPTTKLCEYSENIYDLYPNFRQNNSYQRYVYSSWMSVFDKLWASILRGFVRNLDHCSSCTRCMILEIQINSNNKLSNENNCQTDHYLNKLLYAVAIDRDLFTSKLSVEEEANMYTEYSRAKWVNVQCDTSMATCDSFCDFVAREKWLDMSRYEFGW